MIKKYHVRELHMMTQDWGDYARWCKRGENLLLKAGMQTLLEKLGLQLTSWHKSPLVLLGHSQSYSHWGSRRTASGRGVHRSAEKTGASVPTGGLEHVMLVSQGPGKVIPRQGPSCEVTTKRPRILDSWLGQNTAACSGTHTSDQWYSSQNQSFFFLQCHYNDLQ